MHKIQVIGQKYYESFSGKRVLSNSQLNLILSEVEDEAVFRSISEMISRGSDVDTAGNKYKKLVKKIIRVTEGFTSRFSGKSEPFTWFDFWEVVKDPVYALKLGYNPDVVELFGTGTGFTVREEEDNGEDAIDTLMNILLEVKTKCEEEEDKAYVDRIIGHEQRFRERWLEIIK